MTGGARTAKALNNRWNGVLSKPKVLVAEQQQEARPRPAAKRATPELSGEEYVAKLARDRELRKQHPNLYESVSPLPVDTGSDGSVPPPPPPTAAYFILIGRFFATFSPETLEL